MHSMATHYCSKEMLVDVPTVISTRYSKSPHWTSAPLNRLGDCARVHVIFPRTVTPSCKTRMWAALASGRVRVLQRVLREQGSRDQIYSWCLEISSTREWGMEFPSSARESIVQKKKKKKKKSKKIKDNGKHYFEKVNQGGVPGWLSQLIVWLLISAQVIISQFRSSSPALGSALAVLSLLGILSLSK